MCNRWARVPSPRMFGPELSTGWRHSMRTDSAVPTRAVAALLLGAGLAGCSDSTDCTPTDGAVIVQVRDSISGLPAAGAAVGRIRSPSFFGTLEPVGDGLSLTGAAPPGRYEVTVIAPGY